MEQVRGRVARCVARCWHVVSTSVVSHVTLALVYLALRPAFSCVCVAATRVSERVLSTCGSVLRSVDGRMHVAATSVRRSVTVATVDRVHALDRDIVLAARQVRVLSGPLMSKCQACCYICDML